MVIEVFEGKISTHSNIYYDGVIPHKVTFIEYVINKPTGLKGAGDAKIMIKYISPVDESITGEEVILKYRVTEEVMPLINALYDYIRKFNPTPSSKLSPVITLDIVNLNRKGVHFSYNLLKDNDKIVFSIISQNIEVDGNEFPQVIHPLVITLSKNFNYMRPESKNHMLKLLLEVHKKFINTQYFNHVLNSIQKTSEKSVINHLSAKVIPHIISDISSGLTKIKKRDVDSIISIQRNNFSKTREWALIFINFNGSVNVPMAINDKIIMSPRMLGGEAVKVPLNFIGIDEMYNNIIPDMKEGRW